MQQDQVQFVTTRFSPWTFPIPAAIGAMHNTHLSPIAFFARFDSTPSLIYTFIASLCCRSCAFSQCKMASRVTLKSPCFAFGVRGGKREDPESGVHWRKQTGGAL